MCRRQLCTIDNLVYLSFFPKLVFIFTVLTGSICWFSSWYGSKGIDAAKSESTWRATIREFSEQPMWASNFCISAGFSVKRLVRVEKAKAGKWRRKNGWGSPVWTITRMLYFFDTRPAVISFKLVLWSIFCVHDSNLTVIDSSAQVAGQSFQGTSREALKTSFLAITRPMQWLKVSPII